MSATQAKLSMSKKAIKRREERALLRALKAKQLPKAVKPKAPQGGSNAGFSSQTRVESGKDIIGVVTVRKNDLLGKNLLRFVVNPRSVSTSRLNSFSELWQRWTPVSLKVKLVSAAGLMIPGSYIVAWLADPRDTIQPAGDSNIRKLVSCGVFAQNPVGQNSTLSIPCNTSRKWYAFEGDAFDDSHGVVIVCLSGVIGSSDLTLTATLEWKIKFNGPNIPIEGGDLHIIHNEDDYPNIFTDSVSDWASGLKLTFKHAEGGSVVPWDNLEEGVIYSPVTGSKVTYYKDASSQVECKFFSRMQNAPQYPAALVCHESEAKAKAYIEKGDVSNVLNYVKASDFAAPAIVYMMGKFALKARLDLEPSLSSSQRTAKQVNFVPPMLPDLAAPPEFSDAFIDRLVDKLASRLDLRRPSSPGVSGASSYVAESEN